MARARAGVAPSPPLTRDRASRSQVLRSSDPELSSGLEAPPGWRMVDRFDGFRYALQGAVQGVGMRAAVQAAADELACFGWVQNAPSGRVVGEARCSKGRGPVLRAWLEGEGFASSESGSSTVSGPL